MIQIPYKINKKIARRILYKNQFQNIVAFKLTKVNKCHQSKHQKFKHRS